MSDLIKLDVVDTDGAIREAEEAVAGDSRADFFRKAALGGAATIGGATLLSGFPSIAMGQKPSTKQDVKILNYALTLEYLENEFYKAALKSGVVMTGENCWPRPRSSRPHEAAHVAALRQRSRRWARQGRQEAEVRLLEGHRQPRQTFLETAVVLEDTGVAAYAGQGPRLKTKGRRRGRPGHPLGRGPSRVRAARRLAGKKPASRRSTRPRA